MDKQRQAWIRNAHVAKEDNIARAITATQSVRVTQSPRVDEAVRVEQLLALYQLQGQARIDLGREFQKINRMHYNAVGGISHQEHRKQIREAIRDFL